VFAETLLVAPGVAHGAVAEAGGGEV
jgi:hypothetical protein